MTKIGFDVRLKVIVYVCHEVNLSGTPDVYALGRGGIRLIDARPYIL